MSSQDLFDDNREEQQQGSKASTTAEEENEDAEPGAVEGTDKTVKASNPDCDKDDKPEIGDSILMKGCVPLKSRKKRGASDLARRRKGSERTRKQKQQETKYGDKAGPSESSDMMEVGFGDESVPWDFDILSAQEEVAIDREYLSPSPVAFAHMEEPLDMEELDFDNFFKTPEQSCNSQNMEQAASSGISPHGLRTSLLVPPVPGSPLYREQARKRRARAKKVRAGKHGKKSYSQRKYGWKSSKGKKLDSNLELLNLLDVGAHDEAPRSDLAVEELSSKFHKSNLSLGPTNFQDIPPATMTTKSSSCDPTDILKSQMQCATVDLLSLNSCLIIMKDYLRLTLADPWIVTLSGEGLFLSYMAHPLRPVVDRSIVWENRNVSIFIRNQPLPADNIIWSYPSPDVENLGGICDYLTKLSNILSTYQVCNGIDSYKHLWVESENKGYIEKLYSVDPCFRSFNCTLLTLSELNCRFCRSQASDFLRIQNRKVHQAIVEKDASKINDRYLQREDLIQKVKKLKTDKILLGQKLKRLQKKCDKLIKKNSVALESGLSEDLVNIMHENFQNMSDVQKVFWQQQQIALNKQLLLKSRTMRWHPLSIKIALHLKMLSPTAYNYLKETGFLRLPSERRLFDFSQFLEPSEGCQHELMEQFQAKLEKECTLETDFFFTLMMDEMSIRSNLVYCRSSGQLIGFTNLSEVEKELKDLESEANIHKKSKQELAKKVLVYMARGITTGIVFIPAIFSTDDLTSDQLLNRTWDVIYNLEDYGAKVLCIVCDGASVNRKYIKMNSNFGSQDFVYVTKNIASGDRSRPLYFILDPPHLWKTFRNCLANSYAHRKSRILWKNNEHLSWQVFELLIQCSRGKYSELKLTKAHIKLTSFSCMKVILAVQIFSKSVVNAIIKFKDNELLRNVDTQELCKFLSLMNRFIDCLNGGEASAKQSINPDLKPYTSANDERLDFLKGDFLEYFEEWERDVMQRPGRYSKEQRSRMMISFQTVEAMRITVFSFVDVTNYLIKKGAPSVSARVFNQDFLEQLFSLFRMKFGASNNPNLKDVLQLRLSLHAQGSAALPGSRGNTQVLKRSLELDDTPLPTRKKPKTSKDLEALCLDNLL